MVRVVSRNHKSGIGCLIQAIDYLQVPSAPGLPNGDTYSFTAMPDVARIVQHVLDFVLCNTMVVDVRQARLNVDIETQVHWLTIPRCPHTRPTAAAMRPSIRSANSRFADTNARSASISATMACWVARSGSGMSESGFAGLWD